MAAIKESRRTKTIKGEEEKYEGEGVEDLINEVSNE